MDNDIAKITIANDECLRIHPSIAKSIFEYIYRAAAGVNWNSDLQCFQSTRPNNWDNWGHKEWYRQILSIVRSELGERLRLTENTVFPEGSEAFENLIRTADKETQKWIDENIE